MNFIGFEAELNVTKDFDIYFMILIDQDINPLTLRVNMDNIADFARNGDRTIFLVEKPIACRHVNIGVDQTRSKNYDIRMIKPIFEKINS